MSRNSISFTGKAAHRWNNSLSRVRMNRINRQRRSRLENPLMHETERIALMNAVARLFVERHETSEESARAKVLELNESELLAIKARFDAIDILHAAAEKQQLYSAIFRMLHSAAAYMKDAASINIIQQTAGLFFEEN